MEHDFGKGPEDDLYPNFPVNYLKLDRVPGPDEDWSPVLQALRDGAFFVTTGEVLLTNYSVSAGAGTSRTVTFDAEWTFPLAFVEVVSGDGARVDRQVVRTTNVAPFSRKHFVIPFDSTGKKWVRVSVWDVAGNGAFVQPRWLNR